MGEGAAVRALRAGQGAARFSHYVPRLFEILTVQCAHPAQGVAIITTTAAAAVHGTQERGRLFRRVSSTRERARRSNSAADAR